MDLPTQTHLTTLRNLLTYRLHELEAEVHAAQQAQRQPAIAGTHEVIDRKEEVAQHALFDLDLIQKQRDIDEIAQVQAALQRLDSGTYGDCVDCGEPIPMQRLWVQPAAERCASCQSAHEQAANRHSVN